MNSLDQKIFLTFLGVVFLSLLSLMPQILHQSDGFSGSAIVHEEEYQSLGRINWARKNYDSVCNHSTFENKNTLCFSPDLSQRIFGRIAYYLDLTPEQMFIIGRPFLTMMIFLMMLSIALKCELRFGYAYFFSLFCFLSPSSFHFKPMMSLLTGDYVFQFNRMTTPLVPLSFYFGALISLCNMTFSKSHHIKSILFGVFCFSIAFSLHYPFWISLCLMATSLLFLAKERSRKIKIAFVIIVSLALGVSSVLDFIHIRQLPHMSWVLWRNGLGLEERGIYLAKSVAIWVLFILSFLLFKKDHPISKEKRIFLFLFYFSSLLCYLSPIFIGLSFRNDVFKYILVPSSMLIYAQSLYYFSTKYKEKIPKIEWKSSSRTSFAMIIVICIFSLGMFASLKFYESGRALNSNGEIEKVRKALSSLELDLFPDSVFMGSGKILNMIPGIFGLRVYQDSPTEMTQSQELFDRNIVIFKMRGLTKDSLREYINIRDHKRLWPWGLNSQMQSLVKESKFKPAEGELRENLLGELVKDFESSSDRTWHQRMYQYRMDYLVTLEEENWDIGFIRSFFDLSIIYDQYGVKIYKLAPNRHQ